MTLILTGQGPVKGPLTSTDNGVVRWDGTTGELVKDSSVTINDAGDITAPKFIGDGSLLTNLPGVAGSGDVVGPASSIDFRVPTFDGITGKLFRQSGVSIDAVDAMSGVTKLTIGKLTIEDINSDTLTNFLSTVPIRFNGDFTVWTGGNASTSGSLTGGSMMLVDTRLITTGANQSMTIEPNGAGDLIINADTIINYSSGPAILAQSAIGSVGLRVKQGIANQGTIIDFYKNTNVRKGWFGYGSSSDRDLMFIFNDVGNITITPSGSNPTIEVNGFTKLGGASAPGVKMKLLTGVTSSSSTGSVSKAHGLNGGKIVSVDGVIAHATNSGITPGYEGGGGSFDWDIWFDSGSVHILNNGSNIANKAYRIIITYLAG